MCFENETLRRRALFPITGKCRFFNRCHDAGSGWHADYAIFTGTSGVAGQARPTGNKTVLFIV
jgi:hypothetical protein